MSLPQNQYIHSIVYIYHFGSNNILILFQHIKLWEILMNHDRIQKIITMILHF